MTTLTTPGETVDVLVTEEGVAVNPRRDDLRDRIRAAGIAVVPIEELRHIASARVDKPRTVPATDRIGAIVEYRDGTVIDVVRAVS